MKKKREHICIGCGHRGDIYDFSPSIKIADDDFRFFHFYDGKNGPLYCVECKKRHLIEIAEYKNLSEEQVNYLKASLKSEEEWNGIKKKKD